MKQSNYLRWNFITRATLKSAVWVMTIDMFAMLTGLVFVLRGHVAWGTGLLLSVSVISSIVVLFRISQIKRSVRAKMAESGGRLCLQCAYNRRDIPDDRPCPECGAEFDFAVCKQVLIERTM